MKSEIITLLRQRGTYVSGQELCERFGVSRTAVWKAVEQLKKDGYQIEAVKNRGYLLKEDATRVFGRTELESRIKTDRIGQTLYYYDSIDSTNIQAKRLAEEGAPDGTVVVANQQSAGRGRRGRGWVSPAGTNLYFTLLLRPHIAPDRASMLTLVMALAVAQGIQATMNETLSEGTQATMDESRPNEMQATMDESRLNGMQTIVDKTLPNSMQATKMKDAKLGVGIKWPNDIVINGRKACGILTELSLSVEQGSIDYLVIGVGINVARQEFPAELQGHAIALDEVANRPISRSELLNAVLTAFEADYGDFLATMDLTRLKGKYDALLVNYGRQVRVLDPKGEYDGIARGVQTTGELIVELPDGNTKDVYAGEVSVRGIYGYV